MEVPNSALLDSVNYLWRCLTAPCSTARTACTMALPKYCWDARVILEGDNHRRSMACKTGLLSPPAQSSSRDPKVSLTVLCTQVSFCQTPWPQ